MIAIGFCICALCWAWAQMDPFAGRRREMIQGGVFWLGFVILLAGVTHWLWVHT